jgi:hypothetical protein
MSGPGKFRRLFLLMAAFAAFAVHAQDDPPNAEPPAPPELSNLQSGWWSYFEPTGDEDDPGTRVEPFLADVEAQLATLRATNEEAGQSIFEAIRENLGAYLELLGEGEEEPRQLEPPRESYTIAELLEVASAPKLNARSGY